MPKTQTTLRHRVLQYVRENPESRADTIAEELDVPGGSVGTALVNLHRRGRVSREWRWFERCGAWLYSADGRPSTPRGRRPSEYWRDYHRRYRAARIAAGICVVCSDPAVVNRRKCESCLAAERERYHQSRVDNPPA